MTIFQLKDAKIVTKIYIKDENDLNKLINKLMSYSNRCEKYPELSNKINQLISDISPSCSIGEIAGKDSYQQNIAILNKYMNFDLKVLKEINKKIDELSGNNASKEDQKLFSKIQSECGKIQKDRENEHHKEGLAGGDLGVGLICVSSIVICCAINFWVKTQEGRLRHFQ